LTSLAFLNGFSCVENIRFCIIEFSTDARYVTTNENNPDYTMLDNNLITQIQNYFVPVDNCPIPNIPRNDDYCPGGSTNWQAAFQYVDNLPPPDLLVFFSDGDPTVGTGQVQISKQIKCEDTHIFMVGVGGNINEENLREVSGETEFDPDMPTPANSVATSDYIIEEDVNQLTNCLSSIAQNLCPTCNGVIEVTKLIDVNCDDIGDIPDEGWQFELYDNSNTQIFTGTTNASGKLTINGLKVGDSYTLKEIIQEGSTPVSPPTGEEIIVPILDDITDVIFVNRISYDAGEPAGATEEICFGDALVLNQMDDNFPEIVDGVVLGFILHNGNTVLGLEYASAIEETAVFFNNNTDDGVPNLPRNQLFYVASVVGPPDSDGFPDLDNPCTVVVPNYKQIVFLEPYVSKSK